MEKINPKLKEYADRTSNIDMVLERTHAYSLKHYPNLSLEEMIDRAYNLVKRKYSKEGYAKNYCQDKDYEEFTKTVDEMITNKEKFKRKYIEINVK